jgi:hypothetical protein
MGAAFTVLIVAEVNVETIAVNKKEATLNSTDRCDQCYAQAYVRVLGITGELTFCAHHFSKIEQSFGDKLEAFAYEVIDERWRLLGSK